MRRTVRGLVGALITIVALALIVCLIASRDGKEEGTQAKPLVIERNVVDTSSGDFKKAVNDKVVELLNDDVTLTVYSDDAEDFCYYGKVDLISTESGLSLVIHATSKVEEDYMEIGE